VYRLNVCHREAQVPMTALIVIAFVALIGPLAVLYGADSRCDDRRDGWPGTRR
jgi:hypothetical protein